MTLDQPQGGPRILSIIKSFNPADFIGEGSVLIEEAMDRRSLLITEIDPTMVIFKTVSGSEQWINGTMQLSKLEYVYGDLIRLGADHFLAFWEDYLENKKNSVLEWFYRTKKITYLDFFGTPIRHWYYREHCVLALNRYDHEWKWTCRVYSYDWNQDTTSALYPSLPNI